MRNGLKIYLKDLFKLFYSIIFMVHVNISILPPFYPLFSLSVTGVLINNLNLF